MQVTIERISFFAAAALAVFLLVGFTATGPEPMDNCQGDCHVQKSRAGQKCRSSTIADRKMLDRCFRRAERQLRRCLRDCSKKLPTP